MCLEFNPNPERERSGGLRSSVCEQKNPERERSGGLRSGVCEQKNPARSRSGFGAEKKRIQCASNNFPRCRTNRITPFRSMTPGRSVIASATTRERTIGLSPSFFGSSTQIKPHSFV